MNPEIWNPDGSLLLWPAGTASFRRAVRALAKSARQLDLSRRRWEMSHSAIGLPRTSAKPKYPMAALRRGISNIFFRDPWYLPPAEIRRSAANTIAARPGSSWLCISVTSRVITSICLTPALSGRGKRSRATRSLECDVTWTENLPEARGNLRLYVRCAPPTHWLLRRSRSPAAASLNT